MNKNRYWLSLSRALKRTNSIEQEVELYWQLRTTTGISGELAENLASGRATDFVLESHPKEITNLRQALYYYAGYKMVVLAVEVL